MSPADIPLGDANRMQLARPDALPEWLLVTTTSGSRYLFERGWLTRVLPRPTSSVQVAGTPAPLRRDGEAVRVLLATTPVQGQRWELLLQVREDGVPTLRTTTPVVSVVLVDRRRPPA